MEARGCRCQGVSCAWAKCFWFLLSIAVSRAWRDEMTSVLTELTRSDVTGWMCTSVWVTVTLVKGSKESLLRAFRIRRNPEAEWSCRSIILRAAAGASVVDVFREAMRSFRSQRKAARATTACFRAFLRACLAWDRCFLACDGVCGPTGKGSMAERVAATVSSVSIRWHWSLRYVFQ
jgi:hypothetical protein